ncbi:MULTISPECIES: hypothetical protein [unclassified Microbacterium]|uniref:hypothetical protein n=1 Tax=unclassified Microbacterium TaxID=2609290 RepID=UPI0030191FAF
MSQSAPSSRRRAVVAGVLAAGCVIAAIGFGLMTAGVGMPRIPPEGIRVTVPKYLTVSDDDGRSARLFTSFDGEALVDGEIVRLDVLDTQAQVPDGVPIDAESAMIMPGEAPPRNRTVRGQGVDADGEAIHLYDKVVPYVQFEGDLLLPEDTSPDGERVAAMQITGVFVQTDDPAVSRIFPAYNATLRSDSGAEEEVPQWDMEFDFAAAHAQGRTNLPLPLGWYASPFAHGLDAAAPWMLGGSVVVGLVALVIARRAHLKARDEGLLRT